MMPLAKKKYIHTYALIFCAELKVFLWLYRSVPPFLVLITHPPSPSNSKFLSHLASSLVLSFEILRGGGEGDLSHPNPPPTPQCPENESWARDQERNEIPKMGATSIPEFHSLVGKNKQNRRIMPVVISHMKYNDESFAVASIGAFSTFCIALWTLYLVLGIKQSRSSSFSRGAILGILSGQDSLLFREHLDELLVIDLQNNKFKLKLQLFFTICGETEYLSVSV